MAKNQSPYTVFAETEDGGTVAVAPGDDLPAGHSVTNPYVLGKQKADEAVEEPLPEAGDGDSADEAPRSRARKSS